MWRIIGLPIAAVLAVATLSAQSEACNRCGLFGNKCRFREVHAQHVEYYRDSGNQGDVYVLQNNYPPPLVGQGTTLYSSTGGYQQLALPLLDPNQYFHQEIQLLKAADATNALRSERASALMKYTLELQAPTVERLAAGQSAAMVLNAAGLNGQNQDSDGQAVIIRRDQYGKLQVQAITGDQVQRLTAKVEAKIESDPPAATEPVAGAGKWPLLTRYCFKCHGLDNASPKAGLYLGNDPNVASTMRDKFFAIRRAVKSGQMPPASAPQPTEVQRDLIVNEIEDIIISQQKEKE